LHAAEQNVTTRVPMIAARPRSASTGWPQEGHGVPDTRRVWRAPPRAVNREERREIVKSTCIINELRGDLRRAIALEKKPILWVSTATWWPA